MRPQHAAGNTTGPASQGGSDVVHLSAVMLALLGNHAVPATPVIPTQPDKADKALTAGPPPIPTPSKLCHFLAYAEKNLGVPNACQYKHPMEIKGLGPDILYLVSNKELADIGFSTGNIIHLKSSSQKWWNGPDAKHKHSLTRPEPLARKSDMRDILWRVV